MSAGEGVAPQRCKRLLLLGFAVAASIFFLVMIPLHPFLGLAVLFLSHMLILYATLVANCQWWGPVVTHFETPRREVWLTIDDGPDPRHTPRILEILKRFEIDVAHIPARAWTLYDLKVRRARQRTERQVHHDSSRPSRVRCVAGDLVAVMLEIADHDQLALFRLGAIHSIARRSLRVAPEDAETLDVLLFGRREKPANRGHRVGTARLTAGYGGSGRGRRSRRCARRRTAGREQHKRDDYFFHSSISVIVGAT